MSKTKKKPIRFNLDNPYRLLLSDVLPTEIPIILNNQGFYMRYKDDTPKDVLDNIFKNLSTNKSRRFTIPFTYKIPKNEQEVRYISIAHPFVQIDVAHFFKDYQGILIHLFQKGKLTSLRYPTKLSGYVYRQTRQEDKYKFKNKILLLEEDDLESKYFVSYFAYKYAYVHQFYSSSEFLKLEKTFKYWWKADISNCFGSIYTHSVVWAFSKNKDFVKQNLNSKTFADDFDKLMQASNYNETNGIIIGWEISRIFAELILQEIDRKIIVELLERRLKFNIDYMFRRYVDDYFIFTNNKEVFDTIYQVMNDNLNIYKLSFNQNKLKQIEQPFITSNSIVAEQIFSLMDEIEENYLNNANQKNYVINNLNRKANSIINKIKALIKSNDVGYIQIINLLLGVILNRIMKVITEFSDGNVVYLADFIILNIKVATHILSIMPTIQSTNKLILSIQQSLEFMEDRLEKNTFSNFEYELFLCMKELLFQNANQDISNVEISNILIGMTLFGKKYQLDEDSLMSIFPKINEEQLNYFEIISILFYVGKDEDNLFSNVKGNITNQIANLLKTLTQDKLLTDAEITLLFFDLSVCPYFNIKLRKEIIKKLAQIAGVSTANLNLDNMTEENFNKKFNVPWFTEWQHFSFIRTLVKQKIYLKERDFSL